MVFTESSKDRVQALLKLMKSSDYSESVDKLLNAELPSEEIVSNAAKSIYSDEFKDWSKIIKCKPVYKSMKSIVDGSETDDTFVTKVVTSLITQMLIRTEKCSDFPLELLGALDLTDILLSFINTRKVNIDKVKELFSKILFYLDEGSEK